MTKSLDITRRRLNPGKLPNTPEIASPLNLSQVVKISSVNRTRHTSRQSRTPHTNTKQIFSRNRTLLSKAPPGTSPITPSTALPGSDKGGRDTTTTDVKLSDSNEILINLIKDIPRSNPKPFEVHSGNYPAQWYRCSFPLHILAEWDQSIPISPHKKNCLVIYRPGQVRR